MILSQRPSYMVENENVFQEEAGWNENVMDTRSEQEKEGERLNSSEELKKVEENHRRKEVNANRKEELKDHMYK